MVYSIGMECGFSMNWFENKIESRVIADARLHYVGWLESLRK